MKLLDISENIDEYAIAFYEVISEVSVSLESPFFVVGATARDIILEKGFNIRPFRATEDIDLGVQVRSWEEFQLLKNGLLGSGKFKETKEVQTLIYDETHPLDIVPFGEIGSSDNHIQWPPEHAIRMSIEGFEECYQNAVQVRLREDPPLDIKVVSLPGLAILKVLSWKDRGIENNKDAKDLGIILHNYANAGNEDRLFNEESGIMVLEDFDIDLAGARLLGRDMARICSPATKLSLVELLEPELNNEGDYRLVRGMESSPRRDGFERNTILLTKLLLGLKD